jgi:hypothetical protein
MNVFIDLIYRTVETALLMLRLFDLWVWWPLGSDEFDLGFDLMDLTSDGFANSL